MSQAKIIVSLTLMLLVVLSFTRFFVFGFIHAGTQGPPEPIVLAQMSKLALRIYLLEVVDFVSLALFLLGRHRKV